MFGVWLIYIYIYWNIYLHHGTYNFASFAIRSLWFDKVWKTGRRLQPVLLVIHQHFIFIFDFLKQKQTTDYPYTILHICIRLDWTKIKPSKIQQGQGVLLSSVIFASPTSLLPPSLRFAPPRGKGLTCAASWSPLEIVLSNARQWICLGNPVDKQQSCAALVPGIFLYFETYPEISGDRKRS